MMHLESCQSMGTVAHAEGGGDAVSDLHTAADSFRSAVGSQRGRMDAHAHTHTHTHTHTDADVTAEAGRDSHGATMPPTQPAAGNSGPQLQQHHRTGSHGGQVAGRGPSSGGRVGTWHALGEIPTMQPYFRSVRALDDMIRSANKVRTAPSRRSVGDPATTTTAATAASEAKTGDNSVHSGNMSGNMRQGGQTSHRHSARVGARPPVTVPARFAMHGTPVALAVLEEAEDGVTASDSVAGTPRATDSG